MYAGEAYNNTYALGGNKKAQTLVEPQFAYFCNWVPNTNRDGSPSADNEDTQAIINHSDPRQRNVIACAFLKGLLSNWKDIGKMDIRELKRQVDDVVYKLLPATPEDEIYWGEATPLQDFEKTYSIW
jgi:hypothetical protein